MKITITNIKFLEKIAKATVKNESDAVFENTTIFANFPDYSNLKEGSVIEGELIQNDYNGKVGWKINAPKVAGKGNAGIAAAVDVQGCHSPHSRLGFSCSERRLLNCDHER